MPCPQQKKGKKKKAAKSECQKVQSLRPLFFTLKKLPVVKAIPLGMFTNTN